MKFTIQSAGGVAGRTTIDGHELVFDQPVAVGGQDLGPSPLDVMVASVGACAHYFAAAFLRARKYDVAGLSVTVDADKATEGPRRLASVRLRVHLPPGVPDELLPRIEQAVRGCPAMGTLLAPPELTLALEQSALEQPAADASVPAA